MALKRIRKDYEEMQKNPPPLCTAGPAGDDFFQWEAIIMGPPKTPYEGGVFKLKINFPEKYPFEPPNVSFITRVYHPNISSLSGHTCLNILGDQWRVVYGISQVLLAVTALLDKPNPDDPLNDKAADLYKSNRQLFNKKAAEETREHAMIN